ncbi:hypothetical protein MJH12_11975, partial [bacterium]|nr:hypothetical protein [bacterium]
TLTEMRQEKVLDLIETIAVEHGGNFALTNVQKLAEMCGSMDIAAEKLMAYLMKLDNYSGPNNIGIRGPRLEEFFEKLENPRSGGRDGGGSGGGGRSRRRSSGRRGGSGRDGGSRDGGSRDRSSGNRDRSGGNRDRSGGDRDNSYGNSSSGGGYSKRRSSSNSGGSRRSNR